MVRESEIRPSEVAVAPLEATDAGLQFIGRAANLAFPQRIEKWEWPTSIRSGKRSGVCSLRSNSFEP